MGERPQAPTARSAPRGGWRRALALAVAVVLVLGLAAPLAAVLDADESASACCRGRCCCNGAAPDDRTCVRAQCHCGGDRRAFLPGSTLPEVVLTRTPALVAPPLALVRGVLPAASAPWRDLSVPRRPPRSLVPDHRFRLT